MQWVQGEYAVQDGQIAPVPGTAWETYSPADCPLFYLDLVNLYPGLHSGAAVERVVCRWGLLGLYQQQVRQIRIPRAGAGGDLLVQPGALLEASEQLEPVAEGEVDAYALRREDTAEEWFREVPFAPLFARYFPRLQWPDALRTDGLTLWDHLHEPLDEFREAVERLHKTFTLCTLWSAGERDEATVGSLNYRFGSDLGGLRSRVEFGPSGPVLTPELPSLLAAAYHRMLLDLHEGRYFRFCRNERCGKALVTERLNTYYCSARCMEAVRKRAYRARVGT